MGRDSTADKVMARRAPHPCGMAGCSRLVIDGSRCEMHRLPRQRDDRDSAAARGYGEEWRKIRGEYLRRYPFCADPYHYHINKAAATMVDHIKPKKQGGTDDDANLQGLCYKCHARKTAHDGSRAGGARGYP